MSAGMERDLAALLAATFRFNNISIEDGYTEADKDEDDRVSLLDLVGFCQDLQLGGTDETVLAFYKSLDPQGKGFIEQSLWIRALQDAERRSEELLVSRGVGPRPTDSGAQKSTGVVVGKEAGSGYFRTDQTSVAGVATDVDSAADQLAAAVLYNELSLEEAFKVLDYDNDNFISMDDLGRAAVSLALNVIPDALLALHKAMDERSNGLIEIKAWCTFLSHRNTDEVLRSRGVDASLNSATIHETSTQEQPAAASHQANFEGPKMSIYTISDMIAVLLEYNELTTREGFETFDDDEDNMISMADLTKAAETTLSLEVDAAALKEWFQFYNTSGSGMMSEEEWNRAMTAANLNTATKPSIGSFTSTQTSAPKTEAQDEVSTAADELAAALRYNELSPRSGFERLDVDCDGCISMADLEAARQRLELNISPEPLAAMHKAMDERGDGLVDVDAWTRFLTGRQTDAVLRSRGVTTGVITDDAGENSKAGGSAQVRTPTTVAPGPLSVEDVSNTIAALLDFNHLEMMDGFEAFDVDLDDKISMDDLKTAAQTLELQVAEHELKDWFRAVNVSGDGCISFEEWRKVLAKANSESVLRSRGVVLPETNAGARVIDTEVIFRVAGSIVASLKHNELNIEEGFCAFDLDGDEMLSLKDLIDASNSLQLDLETSELEQFLSHIEELGGGKSAAGQLAGWKQVLDGVDDTSVEQVLRSRGVDMSKGVPPAHQGEGAPPQTPEAVELQVISKQSPQTQSISNTIAAILQNSNVTVEEGFGEFDRDQDGLVSFKDLTESCELLEMGKAHEDLTRWYHAMDTSKPGTGIAKDTWIKVLKGADSESVLRSHGVELRAVEPPGIVPALVNTDVAKAMSSGKSPQEVSAVIAALLMYNSLSFEDAFREFDQDADGKISRDDFNIATNQLQTDVSTTDLLEWHRNFNVSGDGLMTFEEWMAALQSADADAVLKSHGVTRGDAGSRVIDTEVIFRVAGSIVASLKHNELNIEEGFCAFDLDGDEMLSLKDLIDASNSLQLDLETSELEQFLSHIEELGGGKSAAGQLAGWKQVLDGVDDTSVEQVLRSRGVDMSKGVPPAHQGEGAPPQTPAVSQMPLELKTPESVKITLLPPSENVQPPVAAASPSDTNLQPPAAAGAAPDTNVQPLVAAASAAAAAAAASPTDTNAQGEGAPEEPSIKAQMQAADDFPAKPKEGLRGEEAPAALSEQAESTAEVSWHEAVPITLTLDVDFNLIGDHEAFKQDVITDIATAANVNAKYMKIVALRAGSVIVDMLIASEAGEPTKIVQGLLEQLRTPDSPLMRGKFTSKTKSLNPAPLAATATRPSVPLAPVASPQGVSNTQMELWTNLAAPPMHNLPEAAQGEQQLMSAPAAAVASAASVQRPSLAAVTATEGDSPAPVAPMQSAAASRTDAELKQMPSFEEKLQQARVDLAAHAELASMSPAASRAEPEQMTSFEQQIQQAHAEIDKLRYANTALQEEVESLTERLETEVFSHAKFRKESQALVELLEIDLKSAAVAAAAGDKLITVDLVNAAKASVTHLEANEKDGSKVREELAKALKQVKELENELATVKRSTTTSSVASSDDGAGREDTESLKLQVRSLTFQLQELQGAVDTPREVPRESFSRPPLTLGSTSLRSISSASKSPTSTSATEMTPPPMAPPPRRNVLEPPPKTMETDFLYRDTAGSGRVSGSGSRRSSPERISHIVSTGPLNSRKASPMPSPPLSPQNSFGADKTIKALTKQLDESLQELNELRAKISAGEERTAALAVAHAVELQTAKVVYQATLNALSQNLNYNDLAELQEALAAGACGAASQQSHAVATAKATVPTGTLFFGLPGEAAAGRAQGAGAEFQESDGKALATGAALQQSDAGAVDKAVSANVGEVARLREKVDALLAELEARTRENEELKARAAIDTSSEGARMQEYVGDALQIENGELKVNQPSILTGATAGLQSAVLLEELREREKTLKVAEDKSAFNGALDYLAHLQGEVKSLQTELEELKENEKALKEKALQAELEASTELTRSFEEEMRQVKDKSEQELQAAQLEIAKLKEQIAEASQFPMRASEGKVDEVKAEALKNEVEKLTKSLEKTQVDAMQVMKENLELMQKAEESGKMLQVESKKADQEAAALKSSMKDMEIEKEHLKQQVHALERQVSELRGKDLALQEQLSGALADLDVGKELITTLRLELQEAQLNMKQLLEVESKLQARLTEALVEKGRGDVEIDHLRKELEEYKGSYYGEIESLKAQLEIERRERESQDRKRELKENRLESASAHAVKTIETAGDATAAEATTQGSMLQPSLLLGSQELAPLNGGAVRQMKDLLGPLASLDSELNRLQEERSMLGASNRQRQVDVTHSRGNTPTPSRQSSPSRQIRRDLQERLDLLAAALSYNGLTVLSGFSAFDQDHDGRISMEDLRKSMHDLELSMQAGELKILFNFMDSDSDGFVSETEWSTALRDADPFSVLASQGIRTLELKVPKDADAPMQAVESFELIKEQLAKSLEAQKRLEAEKRNIKASLQQALHSRAELEEDLRKIRKTRSELETELRSVREQVSRVPSTSSSAVRYAAPQMDPSVPLYHDRIIVAHQKRSSYEPPAIIRYDNRRGEAVDSPGAVDFQGQERIVQVPGPERIVYTEKVVEKIVEVPGPERIVEVQVPGPERIVYNEKIVEKIVEVPGPERIAHNNKIVEKIVEVPGPERIVEVQVPGPERIVYTEKIVEKIVEVPGPERIVQTEKIVEKIVELPGPERIVEVQVPGPERIVYTEKIVEKIVEVPVERIVEKILHVNVESVVEAEAPATSPPRSSSPLLPLPSSNRSSHTKEPSSNTTASEVSEHIRDELEELRSKYTESHALLEAACKERDAAVAQVPSLRSAAEFAKDQLQLKTSELASLDKELAELRAQCQGSEEQNIKLIELQARVTARESDVGRLREEVARLKEEAQTCAREIAHLKGESSAQKEVHASQIAEMQALAGDARLYAIEHEHKLVAQKKLEDARFKILGLEEQIEQLHVLRSTDVVRASEAATVTVQDRLLARETEIQELRAQVDKFKGDIEAARRDRDALVVRQTQSLQDELLRVNDLLTASERHKAALEQQVLDVQKQVMDSQTQVADLHASGLKNVGELQRQVVELQGRLQASASQLSTAVDTSVVVDYKHALALKEKEIEGLRSKRAHELEEREQALEQGKRLNQELARQKEELARQKEESAALLVDEQRRAGSLTNELSLANESSREEIANLRRRLRDLNEDTSVQDAMHALRASKEAVERDLQVQRSRGDALEGQLKRAQEELTKLRETAAQIGVMQERVRATESEMALANARLETSLERVDALQRELERKERDLTEERDRYDRLQAQMREKRGGTGAERVEWESKYAGVEKRLQELQDLRRKAEFDLSISVKERAALEAKVNEITDEVASARVRIASLESDLRFAQQGQGESTEHLQQRIRQISESKDKYERKYRETQKQLKESQEACVRLERRYTDLQEELNTSLGPTDSQAQAAIRRAEDTAARERESRKAIQAQFDALNEEHRRLKAEMSLPVSSAHAGASDSGHLQLRVRSLLRENAECHAQIRLLGAEVVGLSEALEVVTKRAHDGETKQRIIRDQVEYATKGVASTRTLGQSTKTSKSTRSGDQINTSRTRSPFPSAQEYEHERAYYPNDLYPSAPRSRQDASPPRERPASASMRRRPASAGRRPSSARERIEDGRDSTRAEAWGSGATGGSGSSMPRLQDRDRERVLELGRMRDEVYYGVGGRRDRSP